MGKIQFLDHMKDRHPADAKLKMLKYDNLAKSTACGLLVLPYIGQKTLRSTVSLALR